jgi:hypothetical protein
MSGADMALSRKCVCVDLIVANSRERSFEGVCSPRVAGTEEALPVGVVHQGLPHGFRSAQHLLDVEFHLIFNVDPAYRIMYISGSPVSSCWLDIRHRQDHQDGSLRGTLCTSPLVSPRNFDVCLISYHNSAAIPWRRALRSLRSVFAF